MKTIDELFSDLNRLDVKVWADGDLLRFAAPRETPPPEILAELRARRGEMLEFLAKKKSDTGTYFPPILPVSRDAPLPISYSQEGFWRLEELIPGNFFSNLISAVHINGRINIKALEQAFSEIIRRHEVLRTTFVKVDGQPTQVVCEAYPCALSIEDLSEYSEDEINEEFFRRTLLRFQQPFDFNQGPMFRAFLLRLNDEEHVLLQTMHHIICDGWSMQILNHEVALLYEAFSEDRPYPLPKLPIQYADFAAWQRRILNEGLLEAQLAYWRQRLNCGKLPGLKLPMDYPRPAEQSFQTSRQIIRLSKHLTEALKSLSYDEGCSVMMMLLSAFKVLLHGLTAQADIRVGTVVAIRNQRQLEGLIGLFINTLILRTNLSDDPTLRVVMQRVRNTVLEAYEHQDLPFECLVQAFEQDDQFKRDHLFQVMFLYHPPVSPPLELAGLTFQVMDFKEMDDLKRTPSTFDLIFTLQEKPEGLTALLTYKKSLFSERTIDRMLRYFKAIVESFIADPESRLSALPLP